MPFLSSYNNSTSHNSSECIKREIHNSEFYRLVNLNIEESLINHSSILVIGKNTPIGSALVDFFIDNKIFHHSIGCQHYLSFKPQIVQEVLNLFNFSQVYFTCSCEFPEYSETNGSSYMISSFLNYSTDVLMYFKRRNIPIIYSSDNFVPDSILSHVQQYASKIILFDPILSEKGYHAEKILQCKLNHSAHIEKHSPLSMITPREAVLLLMNQKNNIHIRTSQYLSFTDVLDNCFVETVKSPHYPLENKIKLPSLTINFNLSHKDCFVQKLIQNYNNSLYVSIVFIGRNDDYAKFKGATFLNRFEICLQAIEKGYQQNPTLSFEIIFVDYGTSPDLPTCDKILHIPPLLKDKMRFVVIPKSETEAIHAEIGSKVDFQEYVAKNIGILKAKGKFILMLNADSVVPPALIRTIAHQELNPFILYRCLTKKLSTVMNASQVLKFAQKASEPWIPFPTGMGSYMPNELYFIQERDKIPSFFDLAPGNMALASNAYFNAIGGFYEGAYNTYTDSIFDCQTFSFLPGYAHYIFDFSILHLAHIKINAYRGDFPHWDVLCNSLACHGHVKSHFNNSRQIRVFFQKYHNDFTKL